MSHDGGQVHLPPFAPEYRASGLLMHVTSLPSPYGIGDFGPGAFEWVDRLHEAGQGWWQSLPLGPIGYGNSPYQSMSSFEGNGLLISPQCLIEDELLDKSDCESHSLSATVVNYEAVTAFKYRLLEVAWNNFTAGVRADLRPSFEQFCSDHGHWLEDYALFRALKAKHNGADFVEWPEDLVRREPGALARARHELRSRVDQGRFAQFLLFRQAERLKGYATPGACA
jgi:4-alpha-glucanotransferase